MSQPGFSVDLEWERRKMYLLQCLFGYREDLTPIPERDTAAPSEKIPSEDSSVTSSSLPSLIIEREPPQNKHDDPDEFYEELERSAKKFYLHKVLQNRSYSSFDELESKFGDSSLSSPSIHEESHSRHGTEIRHSIDQENITAEDDFRVEISRSTKADRFEGETEENIFLLKFVEKSGRSPAREMEVMRAQRNLTPGPQFSPKCAIIDETVLPASPKRHNILRERATTSGPSFAEIDIQQASLIDIPIISSPKIAKRKTEDEANEPRLKKKKREKWENIFKNFFVGRPRVFDLVEYFPESSSEE